MRKVNISLVMSVCLSVRMEQLACHWRYFHDIWHLSIFRKSVEKTRVSLKFYKNNGYFTWRSVTTYDHISLSSSQNEKCYKDVEKINTHILCSMTLFFRNSYRLWDNVEKYCRARQATDGNIAHAHCMLDTWGYKHTLRICNTYYFSTTTMAARTHHIIHIWSLLL